MKHEGKEENESFRLVGKTPRQEAQLPPMDRAMRRVSSNLANCHTTVQKLLVRQVLIEQMEVTKLEG